MNQTCRFCSSPLEHTFCDLGKTPPANSYLKSLNQREYFFPLHVLVCERCLLVQLGRQDQTPSEMFSDYSYFSSYSDSWVEHGRKYTEMAASRFHLDSTSFVVEIASNDGYLLQHFKARNIPILGIEPARNVAEVAIEKGIPSLIEFFGRETAGKLGKKASLIIGNNVLAHVPDLNDFVSGLQILLHDSGVITLEFPHVVRLIEQNQFDTIYNEHFSYFSLICLEKIFARWGLELFDVDEIPTHGGSLRVYLQHRNGPQTVLPKIAALINREKQFGLSKIETYLNYADKVRDFKKKFVAFMRHVKSQGKVIVGYGAPAKGNTLLNFCGVTQELLPFTVDKSPHKQGCFLPGTHIPIHAPCKIDEVKPDYLLILPWNLKSEIMSQMAHIRNWGSKFVIPIPEIVME